MTELEFINQKKKKGRYFSLFTQRLNILIKNEFKHIFIRIVYTRKDATRIFIHELRTTAVRTYVSILFCFSPLFNVLNDIVSSVQWNKNIDPNIYITQLIPVSFIKYIFSYCTLFILIESFHNILMDVQLCNEIIAILSIYDSIHVNKKIILEYISFFKDKKRDLEESIKYRRIDEMFE